MLRRGSGGVRDVLATAFDGVDGTSRGNVAIWAPPTSLDPRGDPTRGDLARLGTVRSSDVSDRSDVSGATPRCVRWSAADPAVLAVVADSFLAIVRVDAEGRPGPQTQHSRRPPAGFLRPVPVVRVVSSRRRNTSSPSPASVPTSTCTTRARAARAVADGPERARAAGPGRGLRPGGGGYVAGDVRRRRRDQDVGRATVDETDGDSRLATNFGRRRSRALGVVLGAQPGVPRPSPRVVRRGRRRSAVATRTPVFPTAESRRRGVPPGSTERVRIRRQAARSGYDRGSHADTVMYQTAWGRGDDPWTLASVSYDGRVVLDQVPRAEKYRILR